MSLSPDTPLCLDELDRQMDCLEKLLQISANS